MKERIRRRKERDKEMKKRRGKRTRGMWRRE